MTNPEDPLRQEHRSGLRKAAVISGSVLAPPLTIDPLIIIELQRKWILARGWLEVGGRAERRETKGGGEERKGGAHLFIYDRGNP